MKRVRFAVIALVLQAGLAGGIEAQSAAPLPTDSLERGRAWARNFRAMRGDSLFANIPPGAPPPLSSAKELQGMIDEFFGVAGQPLDVIEERFVWRNGARQFWSTFNAANAPEPVIVRFNMRVDGKIGGMGISRASAPPPTDSMGPVIKPAARGKP